MLLARPRVFTVRRPWSMSARRRLIRASRRCTSRNLMPTRMHDTCMYIYPRFVNSRAKVERGMHA